MSKPGHNARGWRMDGIIRPEKRTRGTAARRQAVRYNEAEDRDLIAQWVAGSRMQDIANWHERSVGGVASRITQLGALDVPGMLP